MNELKINLQRIEGDVVGGSVVSLGIQQSGPSEFTAPLVSVGGLSKLEFIAAQLMPYYLSAGNIEHSVDQALNVAEVLLRKAKERQQKVNGE